LEEVSKLLEARGSGEEMRGDEGRFHNWASTVPHEELEFRGLIAGGWEAPSSQSPRAPKAIVEIFRVFESSKVW